MTPDAKLVVTLTWNNMPYTTSRIFYVACIPRDDMYMQVMDSPTSRLTVIDTNIICIGTK